ncbi:Tetratricopeptide repeat protein 31 [Anabarilius grahami]|uniref:Tetratricopeptide repeat protein 31 n=1 Tax=Anabarilius grahami TaxID=495550 RepID=A0A3N0XX06_ANAGA|nr:Tetratricopeptide repeat protein 31 [Anabarilius grahami]
MSVVRIRLEEEYFRLRDDERLQRTHEAMVDFINDRQQNRSFLDALNFGYGFVPELDHFAAQFTGYEDSSDEDYYDYDDDNDKYGIRTNNRYCGFSRNFLDRGLPKPSKLITAEEAERNAKVLVDEEEKLKKKAEKKKQKKMVQVDPGPEKTKHADKDENENKVKNKNCSSVPSGPQRTSAPVQSSDSSSDEEDDEEEESTIEPEELDMNSCFVSNAAAIAKRKLEQKPKPDKKPQANSRKQRGSEEKGTTTPQKQIDNKEEVKSEETVNANYFITRSVEMAVIGNQCAASGNLEMAVKYFTDAIKYNPKEYKLFGNRSYCYEKMLEYEKALTDADIALSMNPKWIKGLYRKGKALVGLKVLKPFTSVIHQCPSATLHNLTQSCCFHFGQRYYEARLTYGEVLKLDSTCKDAAEEMMRVQLMQLMEMGFTKEQSSNALILHGTVEKALESLSGLSGLAPVLVPRESEFMTVERHPQPPAKFPLRPLPQNQPQPSMPAAAPVRRHAPVGQVHSVRVLQMRHCAFVNYTNKEDCEKAIQDFNGYAIDGTTLVVRYPDRIHTRLGVSRDASTESPGKTDKQPDECYFWRTTGCLKNDRCTYKHIPENKGVDRHKVKSHP